MLKVFPQIGKFLEKQLPLGDHRHRVIDRMIIASYHEVTIQQWVDRPQEEFSSEEIPGILQSNWPVWLPRRRSTQSSLSEVAKLPASGCVQAFREYLLSFEPPFDNVFSDGPFLESLAGLGQQNLLGKILKQITRPQLYIGPHPERSWQAIRAFWDTLDLIDEVMQHQGGTDGIATTFALIYASALEQQFDSACEEAKHALPEIAGLVPALRRQRLYDYAARREGFIKSHQEFSGIADLHEPARTDELIRYLNTGFSGHHGIYLRSLFGGKFDSIRKLGDMDVLGSILSGLSAIHTGSLIHVFQLGGLRESVFTERFKLRPEFDPGSFFDNDLKEDTILSKGTGEVSLQVEVSPVFSRVLAWSQSQLVDGITVVNQSQADLIGLKICCSFQQSWAEPFSISLPPLPPNAPQKVYVPFTWWKWAPRLSEVVEAEIDYLKVEILRGQECVASLEREITVLPGNFYSLRERASLACFVTPNDPALARIMRTTRSILERQGQGGALEGYQSGSRNRVIEIIEAVYLTVSELGISYSNPPYGVESGGQKIRLPGQVIEEEMGTCLDLSVFIAACLQRAGLRPVIVVVAGHAYPGCYLSDIFFRPIEEDVAEVRKKIDASQLLVFDSSSAAKATEAVTFFDACKKGLGYLDSFEFMIDIEAAQRNRFKPLNVSTLRESESAHSATNQSAAASDAESRAAEQAALADKIIRQDLLQTTVDPLSKIKATLMSLSLSNPLLNYSMSPERYEKSKTAIRLYTGDIAHFEDLLMQKIVFHVKSSFQEWHEVGKAGFFLPYDNPDDAKRWDPRHRQLSALLPQALLDKRWQSIQVEAIRQEREKGQHLFYLGVGILEWREKQGEPHNAPFLLYPVILTRDAISGEPVLVYSGEEPRFNETLLTKLRRLDARLDFTSLFLGEDSNDEFGKNIPWLFAVVRERFLNLPGFALHDALVIDQFPFSKFLMWKELEESGDELATHPLMAKLLGLPQETGLDAISTEKKAIASASDDPFPFDADSCLVGRADSSQQEAIQAARDGKTFVLEGPPGTGKTATITNIIATVLAQQRTVLFVAEKDTALEQIEKNLKNVGLEDLALLFPQKPEPKWLVQALFKATQIELPHTDPQAFATALRRWQQQRKTLYEIMRAMHQPTKLGKGAHDVLAELIPLRKVTVPHLKIEWDAILDTSPDWLEERIYDVRRFITNFRELALPNDHPLGIVRTAQAIDEGQMRRLHQAIECAGYELTAVLQEIRVKVPDLPEANLLFCRDLLKQWPDTSQPLADPVAEKLAKHHDGEVLITRMSALLAAKEMLATLEQKIAPVFKLALCNDPNLDSLYRDFQAAAGGMLSVLKTRPIRARLAPFLTNAQVENAAILRAFSQCVQYRKEVQEIDTEEERIEHVWCSITGTSLIDWQLLPDLVQQVSELRRKSIPTTSPWIRQFAAVGTPTAETWRSRMYSAWQGFSASLTQWRNLLDIDLKKIASDGTPEKLTIDTIIGIVQRLNAHVADLDRWARLCERRQVLAKHKLEPLVAVIINGQLPLDQAEVAFRKTFYEDWGRAFLRANHQLRDFLRTEQEANIRDFATADEALLELAPRQYARRFLERSRDMVEKYADKVRALEAETRRKRGSRPLRSILHDLPPEFLFALKPCFIMTPSQVVEYLPLQMQRFDLVIIDEASQMESADAIAVLRRANQWIIVGDSKQMPPSRSGTTGDLDEFSDPDEDAIGDLESILDECVRPFSKQWLAWHYRSKDERLIAFSNEKFYEGRLVTFPGSDTGGGRFGITLHRLKGCFIGAKMEGRTGSNPVEADFIVNWLVTHLRDAQTRKRSVGVVTSNEAQCALIREKLDAALSSAEREIYLERTGESSIQKAPNGKTYEQVWVKALERVQGDERDIILISTGFSAEPGKKITNLGPLMRPGAERRLNVAFTRAREQMIVVTSMESGQIGDSFKYEGPRLFQKYLAFLEKGEEKSDLATSQTNNSLLVDELVSRLEALGYRVKRNLGYSKYRIELVIEGDQPGTYLLAIETDGKTYRDARNTRDREIVRHAILRMFGWGELHRVWLLDYLKDPDAVINRIVEAAERARGRGERKCLQTNEHMPAPANTADEVVLLPNSVSDGQIVAVAPVPINPPIAAAAPGLAAEKRISGTALRFDPYRVFTTDKSFTKEDLDNPAREAALIELIRLIVQFESPIVYDLFRERFLGILGIKKAGKNIAARVRALIEVELVSHRIELIDEVIWDPEVRRSGKIRPRGPDNEVTRTIEQIPIEELAAGMLLSVEHLKAGHRDEIFSCTLPAFGLKRMVPSAQAACTKALEVLLVRNSCVLDGETIRKKKG